VGQRCEISASIRRGARVRTRTAAYWLALGCLLVSLCLGGFMFPRTTATASVVTSASGYDMSGVRTQLQAAVAANQPPGLSLSLRHRNRLIFREAYGRLAFGVPFTTESRVFLASSTKLISMAAVMVCVDRGLIRLDDPVGVYLPAFRDMPVTGSTQRANPTIRQCMAHTSGMRGSSAALDNPTITLEQAVAIIAQENTPLRAQPGTEFFYGGASMHVAGRVVEVVTGTPFDTFVRQNILTPCRMTHTAFTESGDFTANPRVAGGMWSTLDDYLNFLTMLYANGIFEGQRVLSAAACLEMRRDQTQGARIVSSPYQGYGQADTRYGFGWWLNTLDSNGVGINVSDGGALGTLPWIDYRTGVLGVFLSQTPLSQVFQLTEQLRDSVNNAVQQATPPRPNPRTVGVYRPANGNVYLKFDNASGFADMNFFYGQAGDIPVVGDWDGDGVQSVGIFRQGRFFLKNTNGPGAADVVFDFGAPGDRPVAGDWNGDGRDTIGVYRNGVFLLRDTNDAGPADYIINYGNPNDLPVVGDWNGDLFTTVGCFRPSDGFAYLRNTSTSGFADVAFFYGLAGDLPVAGDWTGQGFDTFGVYRQGTFFLRNSNTPGFADFAVQLGLPGDLPLAGRWR
jgi:CubicO group peptidase (beta-lactamase class C family)